jgi:hypothetical protein
MDASSRKKSEFMRSNSNVFSTDPLEIFQMEKDVNQAFFKHILYDEEVKEEVAGMKDGIIATGKKDVPFMDKSIPIISDVGIGFKLLEKDFKKKIGMFAFFRESTIRSGISKKSGKPYSFLKVVLDDGYNIFEYVLWDAAKPLGYRKDSLVYINGYLSRFGNTLQISNGSIDLIKENK